jgi:hypothetical protein
MDQVNREALDFALKTGFPQDFMLKYHIYRNYWPLWALGRYHRLCDKNSLPLPSISPLN